MPSIKLMNVAAGTANALDGLSFQDIPSRGAVVTIYASTPTNGALIGYKVGRQDYLVDAAANVEISADVVDTDRDAILFREPVGPGRQYLSVAAQIANVLVVIEEA